MPASARTALNDPLNCPARSRMRNRKRRRDRRGPSGGSGSAGWSMARPGAGGHAEDVHVAGADLHHEQAVQALQGDRAVHVEEVGGEYRRGLGAQKLPPRRVGAPLGRRRDLQRLEDPADGRCADPVAELEQFALDPLVSPAVVLAGEPPISAAISALMAARPRREDRSTSWRPGGGATARRFLG